MNIVTYNILLPYYALKHNLKDGIVHIDKNLQMDNWHIRKDIVVDNLKKSEFSVCCLQEVSPRIYQELSGVFKSAGYNTHRTDEVKCGMQGVAIFYDPSKLELLAVGKFKSIHEWWRGKVCCDFKDKKTSRVVRVMSIHLKRYDPSEKDYKKKQNAKLQGLQELMYYHIVANNKNIQKIDNLIIAGDFNEGCDAIKEPLSRIKLLKDLGYKTDGSLKMTEKKTGRKIDWIFCKKMSEKGGFQLKPLVFKGENYLGSDHLMAGTKITFI